MSNQTNMTDVTSDYLNLPRELQSIVENNILEAAGEEFLQSIKLASELRRDLESSTQPDDDRRNLRLIRGRLGMSLLTSSLECPDDSFISSMGIGYCYLNSITQEFRIKALKTHYVWPTLQELFSRWETHMVSGFRLYKTVLSGKLTVLHLSYSAVKGVEFVPIEMQNQCNYCHAVSKSYTWLRYPKLTHDVNCKHTVKDLISTPLDSMYLELKVGGLFSRLRSPSQSTPTTSRKRSKSITDSKNHEDRQVIKFDRSVKGEGKEPDMSRDLYSVPKPTEIETMSDHLNNHKSGDTFPYVSVVGTEDETKDGRLSRLRAFRSSYGKENKPEMRINGVILDELEGTIKVSNIGDYVNKENLNKQQRSENKRFRPLNEASFKKPYLQIARITGEYVPLMSSTSDYTELYFTLEDGRLLDNQVIIQSNKLPTNQNGVFELSCDYCINLSDINQLSLKYFLSRPIMKEGFQWGAVSLTIRVSESDTPYLTPKVEAMAIVRIPFSTLEEQSKDPDHADVVFTAKQVDKFKELYRAGDVMDIDEAKRERSTINSYSKSTIRGVVKGEAGPSHLGNQSGWEHLKGMVKPRVEEGQASISVASGSEEVDIDVPSTTREEYEKQQELLRQQFQQTFSDTTEEIPRSELNRSSSPINSDPLSSVEESSPPRSPIKSAMKKPRFIEDTLKKPDTSDVYQFN
ncbi:ORF1 [Laurel Lake virus]|uniref:ORF1 n=1 Tax=Laurel Lake virus TaxID=2027354 RepID=A0A2K9YNI6_9VIRU|nr:ORF1 [Laurel Lake virus]AUW34409.1 ORF1 [Laurel Lake virus]